MSRYADLWPKMPNWVETITTSPHGTVIGWPSRPESPKDGILWGIGKAEVLAARDPVADWRESAEQRPEEYRR